jgi:hypothetical protein
MAKTKLSCDFIVVKTLDGHAVRFTIGHQSFTLSSSENKDSAKWMLKNLRTAFKNLVETSSTEELTLGQEAKDKVTGFTGILTSKISYLTGCDQYSITPPAVNNETKEANFFDEGRIEIVGKGITKEEVASEKEGGATKEVPNTGLRV